MYGNSRNRIILTTNWHSVQSIGEISLVFRAGRFFSVAGFQSRCCLAVRQLSVAASLLVA